ncbi:Serine--tRNA ligase, cytoplasmic [Zea mays]|uniref:Serine--tRNA ligase, cytoplasmic n=1 Tax=Zea mays TaxID=4577 RepID=A0A3L6F848_MAIZE|nr:Serine--tRNA ligase, cytoplasmic [Zea mays]
MLYINLFRADKGDNPDLIREFQRSRFASVELVDEVIALDKAWRERQFELDKIRQELNATSKKIGKLKASKQEEEAKKLMESTDEIKKRLTAKEVEVQEAKSTLDAKVTTIGNIVHESVPVSNDEFDSKDGVWVGHLLSGYSLPMDMSSQVNVKSSEEVAGMWKHSIKVSYEATKAAFPGGEVIAHLDHNAPASSKVLEKEKMECNSNFGGRTSVET